MHKEFSVFANNEDNVSFIFCDFIKGLKDTWVGLIDSSHREHSILIYDYNSVDRSLVVLFVAT